VRRARAASAERAAASAGDRVLIGRDTGGRPVVLPDAALAAHGLILGASGAGKSTTLISILAAEIRRRNAVVAIDLKGSPAFARALERAASEAGRPFRSWSPDGPLRWNPLATGNATELKDKLIATERFTEPHYQRAAERYVQLAVRAWQALHPGAEIVLADVVTLLEPAHLATLARVLPRREAEHVRDYLEGLTTDQLSAVRGLASRLAILTESHTSPFLERTGPADVDIGRALAGDEVVLFSLNSSTYGRLAGQLGTLAVQDLVTVAGRRLASGTTSRAIVAIDEFSALGSDNVIALLARGRESGVGVLLATQELADLDRAARGLREQVLGNTAVKIAHRQDVPESAATVAQMSGRERVWERSYRLRSGLGGSRIDGGTLQLRDRFVVDPERIRSLRAGEAVVILKAPHARTALTRITPPPTGRDLGR
jgi:type IV secretory pathway TraG/TraD family ATPase VirD4